ncbi:hypothetical protein BV898_01394 [Hypsibius exemplaris]|uniref:Uncharacterized protein n=1 Tax=Hypsibius exemplaris TaxID=2072580 RepID=A0A1W0XBV1_HYPEX|nr:hypothetical protein BV898_01394 [Hypsibius exemplaris]
MFLPSLATSFTPNNFDAETKVLILTGFPSKPTQFNDLLAFSSPNSANFEEIEISFSPRWESIKNDTFRLV